MWLQILKELREEFLVRFEFGPGEESWCCGGGNEFGHTQTIVNRQLPALAKAEIEGLGTLAELA